MTDMQTDPIQSNFPLNEVDEDYLVNLIQTGQAERCYYNHFAETDETNDPEDTGIDNGGELTIIIQCTSTDAFAQVMNSLIHNGYTFGCAPKSGQIAISYGDLSSYSSNLLLDTLEARLPQVVFVQDGAYE